MYARVKTAGTYSYLQIVESYRDGGRVRQRVIATLGRLDALQQDGALDALMRSLSRYSQKAKVLDAWRAGELDSGPLQKIGPDMVFSRLWDELGMSAVIRKLAAAGKQEFDIERAAYLDVLHRLMESGSERQADRWRRDYALPGTEGLEYHHLLRANKWLGCNKDGVEEALFARGRDLFSTVTMSFFDTTSIYFEGAGGESLGQYGHSKDHRPDLKQLVLGMLLSGDGRPVSSEIWPGNTADATTLVPVVNRLRTRFGVASLCIVADRGMISADTIKTLEGGRVDYILGARMRNSVEVRDDILRRAGRFKTVADNLQVKEAYAQGRRYIVCHNPEQAAKDRADREAILEHLEEQLARGQAQLIGNKGFRKYLRIEKGAFKLDRRKAAGEEKYDGKWVLRTNTDLPAEQVAVQYKRLLEVETFFRQTKSLVDTRPVWHKWDATISGHIFVSFLALSLRYELMRRIESKGAKLEWNDIRRDLDALGVMQVEAPDGRWLLRTAPQGVCGKVFQSVGVAIPPTARLMDSVKM
jgi:hypothetical protein